jgi:hypothetical protein
VVSLGAVSPGYVAIVMAIRATADAIKKRSKSFNPLGM